MSARKSKPRPGSVAFRLLAYFENNPDEELHPKDAATKLGVSLHSIYTSAWRLTQSEQLECVRVIRMPAKGKP